MVQLNGPYRDAPECERSECRYERILSEARQRCYFVAIGMVAFFMITTGLAMVWTPDPVVITVSKEESPAPRQRPQPSRRDDLVTQHILVGDACIEVRTRRSRMFDLGAVGECSLGWDSGRTDSGYEFTYEKLFVGYCSSYSTNGVERMTIYYEDEEQLMESCDLLGGHAHLNHIGFDPPGAVR